MIRVPSGCYAVLDGGRWRVVPNHLPAVQWEIAERQPLESEETGSSFTLELPFSRSINATLRTQVELVTGRIKEVHDHSDDACASRMYKVVAARGLFTVITDVALERVKEIHDET